MILLERRAEKKKKNNVQKSSYFIIESFSYEWETVLYRIVAVVSKKTFDFSAVSQRYGNRTVSHSSENDSIIRQANALNIIFVTFLQ